MKNGNVGQRCAFLNKRKSVVFGHCTANSCLGGSNVFFIFKGRLLPSLNQRKKFKGKRKMARTKQRKGKRNSTGYTKIVADFNKLVELRLQKLESEFKGLERHVETTIDTALSRFPMDIQNLTLSELLKADESPKKENLPPKTPRTVRDQKKSMKVPRSTTKRVTGVSDDGYQSESTASRASKATVGSKRRSRSSSQSKAKSRMRSISRDRTSKLNVSTSQRTKNDLLKTPTSKPISTNSFMITPKVKLNSAVNVLRKPKDGEMVFSTQGSPLLVSTTINDKTANVNVPLKDGNIISLLPFNDTLSESLNLDDETKHQLKILHSHLSKVLK